MMGSLLWTAPEYLTFNRIDERNEKGDVFSFGVIVWELVAQEVPWKSQNMTADDIKEAVLAGKRLTAPKKCSEMLKNIMKACWENSINRVNKEVLII